MLSTLSGLPQLLQFQRRMVSSTFVLTELKDTINEVLDIVQYPIPKQEDLQAALAGGK